MKGLTLVEMVITIVLVMILSSISIPIYKQNILNAKEAEAYAMIGAIVSAQKTYYAQYGNFLYQSKVGLGEWGISSNVPALGLDARQNKYFNSFGPGMRISRDGGKYNDYEYNFAGAVAFGSTTIGFFYSITTGGGLTVGNASDKLVGTVS